MMALYAANNIAQAIKNFGKRGYARLGGIILNAKNIADEQELVAKAAAEIGTQVVQYVPRSGDIQIAENMGGTVSEFTPASPMVAVYRSLAETVLALSEDVE
jgi:nitrogenase iron protein NifH